MAYRRGPPRDGDGGDRPRPRPRPDGGDRYDRGDRGDYGRQDGPQMLKRYEDWAYELEFLPHGYMDDQRPMHLRDPILQVIGEQYFSILEVILDRERSGAFRFELGRRDFIGKGEMNVIGHRFKRISYGTLTTNAKAELPRILEKVIAQDPNRFLDFFNKSQPITTKMHQLELLPGIGKKTMWQIIEARKKKPFESFADIIARAGVGKPEIVCVKRILKELENPDEKHLIFVRH